jgi:hypothetical protein
MNYRDYCVTVLDKVLGIFRPDVQSMRDLDKDALASAYRDVLDPITASHPELPAQLHLWEEVTKPGRYFDPRVRGFYYVEIYNPMYWMQPQKIRSRICFHPLYRMRTRNTRSPVNDTVIAFWTSAHAEVVAEAPGAVAAPSVHFGFPLWQFDHDEVQKIAEAVFREWKVPM